MDFHICRYGQVQLSYVGECFTKLLENSAGPDYTAPQEQSDLGVHCLLYGLVEYFRLMWYFIPIGSGIGISEYSYHYYPKYLGLC